MKILSAEIIFALAAAIIFFSSCGGIKESSNNISPSNAAQNTLQTSLVQDDIGELGKIINLPFEPEEVVWQDNNLTADGVDQVSASNEKRFVAVVKFNSEDSNRIITQAEKYEPAKFSVIDAENWFPVELIAQSQLSGDETLKGNSYAADDFFLDPFNKGKFTRIANTNYFVVELTSF
jgi:hypothetical protein